MRAIDIFLRVLLLTAAIGSIFLPNPIAGKLFCAAFFAAGVWCILFPAGAIGWARSSRFNRHLDPSDTSLWWGIRVIGAVFILFSLLMFRMR
jgi:hypothetical protein